MKWADDTLIHASIQYGICVDEADFRRELEWMKISTDEWIPFLMEHADATTHYLDWNGKEVAIVCVRPTVDKDGTVIAGMIVHEAVHIWQRIREYIKEENPSHEFEAYAIQRISQNLMCFYAESINARPTRRRQPR